MTLTALQEKILFVLRANGAPMSADAIARELRTTANGVALSLSSPENYRIVPLPHPVNGRTLYREADREYWVQLEAQRERERAS